MNDLVKRIEGLSPARQKLLERLNAKGADRVKSYPLSYTQQSMWFFDQLEPNTSLYNVPFARRYTGPLDTAALWRSLKEIVQRHESLRTIFPTRNGVAVQEVVPVHPGLEQNVDLSNLAPEIREATLKAALKEAADTPFSLSMGPLFRVVLYVLSDKEHVLFFNMHHIVSDGWSVYLLFSELDTLYRAYSHGADVSPLPPVELQFSDYAIWQRGWLRGDEMERQLAFWKAQVGNVAEAVLPTDYPRPAVLGHMGKAIIHAYSPALSASISDFCRAEGVTPFMTLLAVFELVLVRYLGATDFAIGTPVANRNRVETEGVIGCFINTLVIRNDATSDLSFRQLVQRVRERTLAVYEHQEMPFHKLIEVLAPAKTLSRSPLFQVMFSYENYPSSQVTLPGLSHATEEISTGSTKMEMTLTVGEGDGIYRSHLEYDGDLYRCERMQRMMVFFEHVLESVLAQPDRRIMAAAPLPEADRAELAEWQGVDTEARPFDAICAQFERQVRQAPDATAIVADDASLSYERLDRRANQIAHLLRKRGIGAEVTVGVMLERGVGLYTAVLGTMKSGGVYVPLDPSFPRERLAYMAEDASLKVLVVDARTRDLAPTGAWEILDLSAIDAGGKDVPEAKVDVPIEPEQLAYIIYTSGSTGQPKGVGISHRAIANQVRWVCEAFDLTREDRFLHKASICFDASLEEILAPLVAGGSVVATRPKGEYDVLYLSELIARAAVTCFDFTPSLLDTLLTHGDPASWKNLRLVACGAESLSPALVRKAREHLPMARLLNTYGPTETTIQSAWSAELGDGDAVPIGRPVACTSLYVLDAFMEIAPPGTRGELYIGGDGLARGYMHRSGATAAVFVPNPFGPPGSRLYRSGDLVRWRADGQLEFLGRVDHQIKLRGYRIELGEIEQALESHPAVKAAVAQVREDQPGTQQLVAYLVPATPGRDAFPVDGLREHLMRVLPLYMIPAVFLLLDAFPVTPTGKLDRAALPCPEQNALFLREHTPPQGDTETQVAAMFEEVLKLGRVGRHDSFFELGGHSLLAVQLISRLRKAFNREFRLMDLFTHPTVEQVAKVLQIARPSNLPPILSTSRDDLLPLSFMQEGLWFLNQMDGAGRAYHMPLGLRLKGLLDRVALRQGLDRLVARHEALRTTFRAIDGRPAQWVAAAEDGGFHLAEQDLHDAPDVSSAMAKAIREEIDTAFDLEHGPLIRGRLIRVAADEHVLLVIMHHIVSDGWSVGILVRELAAMYSAFHERRADELAPLTLQYGDYAHWQRHLLNGNLLEQQQAYWRAQLGDAPTLLQLPADRARPAQQDFAGEVVGFELEVPLVAALRRLSQTHGTTLYMTLLAGWTLLLARLSGELDVVVGTPAANRPQQELEDLVGFFANMLALRVSLDPSMRTADLLAKTRDVFLAAQQHDLLPLEQVVEAVRPQRSASYSPLFQTMFVWQGSSPGGAPAFSGLSVSGVDMPGSRTAKFDLTLALEDRGVHGIGGGIEFATALFDRVTVQRFIGHFKVLLAAMVADDHESITRLPMLSLPERQHLLHGWNATAMPFDEPRHAHQWIEDHAAHTPHATAVVHGDVSLSYAALNERANRLARYLRGIGVATEERVGLCVERGPLMIVGMLAVLKAGGAYVPMDPAYPTGRLLAMLEDSAPIALLTQAHLAQRLGYEGTLIDMDDDAAWRSLAAGDLPPEETSIRPHDLAYIIYTSGSTGTPKGVMLEHRNLDHFLAWGRETFPDEALKTTLAATSLSFDLAVFECWLPLSAGHGVHIVADVLELAQRDVPVSLVNSVPSAVEALLDAGTLPTTARLANLAGEPLKPSLVQRIFEKSNVESVYNLYGPTETTTYSTYTRVRRGETFAGHIGRPLANTNIYILDRHGEPTPIGVPGELHIGGSGVARGYFRRPELTAERFVRDPFANDAARMYRTGDLARWLADGNIEFLGRIDHQVKLRGYRIELGEIEHVLESHPSVQRAVVIVREDRADIRQLVAYVVSDADVATDGLREHAAQRLPGYMLPAAIVPLERLPTTPNGKLDRKALPAPQADATPVLVEPRTPTEATLVRLFAEVLGLTAVGIQDSFFDLGGHSLLAIRLVARIRSELKAELPLRTLFESPTVAALARHVGEGTGQHLSLRATPRPPVVPLSYGQQRLWFLDQLEGPSTTYNLPAAWRFSGPLDVAAMKAAVYDVVARHESLRTLFLDVGGNAMQLVLGAEQGRPVFTQEDVEAASLQAAVDRAGSHGFRLAMETPLRAWLFRVDDNDHALLLLTHHIASDGGSMGPLFRDLSTAYTARREGRAPEWQPLPVQYADYALWQRQWLGDEADPESVMAKQIAYWQKTLSGLPDCIVLPVDRPRPGQPSFRGGSASAMLDPASHADLLDLGRQQHVTLFMLLHAAVALLLRTLGAGDDVAIGSPSSGRNDEALEPLIGFFVNMLVLRTDLSGNPTFRELLGRVRAADLDAYGNQDLPFDRVVELANPVRSASYHPLFQVMLLVDNAHEDDGKMHDLSILSQDVGADTAKFDLTLHFGERRNAEGAPQGVEIHLEYARDLWDQASADAFVSRLVTLMQTAARSADRPIDDIALGVPAAAGVPEPRGSSKPRHKPVWEAPNGRLERELAGIFEDVLQVERIGRHDDFFDAGGHSLLAIKLMGRLRKAFSITMPMRQIFEMPSVASMAAWMESIVPGVTAGSRENELPDGVIRLKAGDRDTPLFLLHPIGGAVFCYAQMVRSLASDHAVYGLQMLPEYIDGHPPGLAQLARSHVDCMRTVQPAGPYRLGGWSLGGLLAWEMARQLKDLGETVQQLIMIDTYPPILPPSVDADASKRRAIAYLRADIEKREVDVPADAAADIPAAVRSLEAALLERSLVTADTSAEQVDRLLNIYQFNGEAMARYAIHPADLPTLLFVAEAGHPDQLLDTWSGYTLGEMECHRLEESHHTIMGGDGARYIAGQIDATVDGLANVGVHALPAPEGQTA